MVAAHVSIESAEMLARWFRSTGIPVRKPGVGGRADMRIQWGLAERLYVEGELVGEGEKMQRVFPSLRDIAKRALTTKENLQQRIMRYNWKQKREDFLQKGIYELSPASPNASLPRVAFPAMARSRSRADAEAILTRYIEAFALAVERDQVRHDTIADFERAVRLRAFLRGEAESRKHVHTSMTLEVMATRHRELQARVAGTVDDEVAGVLEAGDGDTIEAEGVAVPESSPALPPRGSTRPRAAVLDPTG